MKLNDPLGRVNRKHQAGYLALRNHLHQQGIADRASAATVASGMSRAAMLVLVAIAALGALIALALPGLRGPAWVLGSLLAAWVGGNYFQARMYLKRYVMEECDMDATNRAVNQNSQAKEQHS